MWPDRDVAAYAKSMFSTQVSVTFTFLFSQHSRFLSSKNRELATRFSFLCMLTTISGSNSWNFCDHWRPVFGSQRALRMTGDTDAAKSSKFFLPSFFFFTCFLIFLKKAFFERKIVLEIFKKRERRRNPPNHGSINDERDFCDRRSSKEGNLHLFDYRPKKNAFTFTFLHFLYFLQALLMAKVAYHCLKKYQRVTSFFVNLAGSANLFYFCL